MTYKTIIEFTDGSSVESEGIPCLSADDRTVDIVDPDSVVIDGTWQFQDVKKITFEVL